MRPLILTPAFPPVIGGNARTVWRWAAGLSERGIDLAVADLSSDPHGRRLLARAGEFAPTLFHAHHVWKAGQWLARIDPEGRLPWVVSFAGTDLDALAEGDASPVAGEIARTVRRARRIVVQGERMRERLVALLPDVVARVRLVPKGVLQGESAFPLRARLALRGDEIVFLLPGGLRRVKNQLAAVRAFARLRERCPAARLVLAGQVLEVDYAESVERELPRSEAIRLVIPPDEMGGACREADVVLNTSTAEGFSNALLEGMAAGRAVLASRIGANAEAVEEGRTGLLFDGEEAFVAQAERLVRDAALRARLGEAAAREVARRWNPESEIVALLQVYEEAVA